MTVLDDLKEQTNPDLFDTEYACLTQQLAAPLQKEFGLAFRSRQPGNWVNVEAALQHRYTDKEIEKLNSLFVLSGHLQHNGPDGYEEAMTIAERLFA